MPKKQKSGLYRTKIKIGVDAQGKDINKWVSGRTMAELEDAKREARAYYIEGSALQTDQLFGAYATTWYHVRKEPRLSDSYPRTPPAAWFVRLPLPRGRSAP